MLVNEFISRLNAVTGAIYALAKLVQDFRRKPR